MKRKIALTFIIIYLLTLTVPIYAALEIPPRPIILELSVGQYTVPIKANGTWKSKHPEIATVSQDGVITALQNGYTLIECINAKGKTVMRAEVQVGPVPEPPTEIKNAIQSAILEWQSAANEAFPRFNKFTEWYNPKAYKGFGWCGAFVGYNLENAGVTMNKEFKEKKAPPLMDGSLFAVRQASQTKLFEGFLNRDRLSSIPRPGYYIIYGKKGSTPYTHVGMVTAVTSREDGSFILETVEGNLNSRIRRYNYIYNALADRKEKNIISLPEEQRTQSDIFMYDYVKDFYINCFGQTWY
ncbi:MAG: CHAP domain-containing protein [Eubacteriales bacterium]|nr:CHAP domain-containing protein [Eubacteriales bacterium]